jgi:hypothetical protein
MEGIGGKFFTAGPVDTAVLVAPSALEGGCAGSLHAATIGRMAPMAER